MRRPAVANAGERNDYTFLMYITENATGRYLTYTYATSLPSATLLLYPTSKPRHCTHFGKEGLSVIGLQSRAICLCHFDNQEDFPVGYQGTHIHTADVMFHMAIRNGYCHDMVIRNPFLEASVDGDKSIWYLGEKNSMSIWTQRYP
jgi:hypothetical protein